MSHTSSPHDLVTLVNDHDEVIGEVDKYEAHRYPLQLHRAVSVWLVQQVRMGQNWSSFQVLFQRRSPKKIVGGTWWGNTICGNVRPGETYEECAYRRLREEMGIETAKVQPAYKFQYQAFANEEYGEKEMDQVFVGWYDGEVTINPDEAMDYAWINLGELFGFRDRIKTSNRKPWPTLEEIMAMNEVELRKSVSKVDVTLSARKLELVPWTITMLKDDRLWQALRTLVG